MESDQDGFKKMSEHADNLPEQDSVSSGIAAGADGVATQVSAKLKSSGIDADSVTELAVDRSAQLQDILIREIRSRPFRALGWAAGAGFILGIMSAR